MVPRQAAYRRLFVGVAVAVLAVTVMPTLEADTDDLDLTLVLQTPNNAPHMPGGDAEYWITAEWTDEQGNTGTPLDRRVELADGRGVLRQLKNSKTYTVRAYRRVIDSETGQEKRESMAFPEVSFQAVGLNESFALAILTPRSDRYAGNRVREIRVFVSSKSGIMIDASARD